MQAVLDEFVRMDSEKTMVIAQLRALTGEQRRELEKLRAKLAAGQPSAGQ
jgi:ribosomal protein L29